MLSHDIYIYFELPCHEEQNGGQSLNLQAMIAELLRFKAGKRKKFKRTVV